MSEGETRRAGPDAVLNTEVVDRWVAWAVRQGRLEPGVGHRVRIVSRLASSPRVSGQELAEVLGVSRAAVHKHVEHMRSEGLQVTSLAGSGYSLQPDWDSLLPEAVLPLILSEKQEAPPVDEPPGSARYTASLGLPYRYLPSVPSTNEILKEEAAHGLPAGALLATDQQTAGRGRLGRVWVSQPAEDLTFSYLLRPAVAPTQLHLLVLAASVAVAEAIGELLNDSRRVAIKWPNDVLVDGGKICGILAESSMDMDQVHWMVVGVGVNVNSSPLQDSEEDPGAATRPRAVSLRELGQAALLRGPLLARLTARLSARTAELLGGDPQALLKAYRDRDFLLGSSVVVRAGLPPQQVVAEGMAEGVGPQGELLVRTKEGQLREVVAGEVTLAAG